MFLQPIREPEVVQQGRRHLGGAALRGLRVARYPRPVRRARRLRRPRVVVLHVSEGGEGR